MSTNLFNARSPSTATSFVVPVNSDLLHRLNQNPQSQSCLYVPPFSAGKPTTQMCEQGRIQYSQCLNDLPIPSLVVKYNF